MPETSQRTGGPGIVPLTPGLKATLPETEKQEHSDATESSSDGGGVRGKPGSSLREEGVGEHREVMEIERRGMSDWDWDSDPANPFNWPRKRKLGQVSMAASVSLAATLGTSVITPGRGQLMQEFGVSGTVAMLPLSLYVLALALGPVVGGPLSETVGRYPVYVASTPLAIIFTIGAGLGGPTAFAGVCALRFLAGFCIAPSLAIVAGVLSETFRPAERGLPSTVFLLTTFMGPGIAPVIGSFVVQRAGWRWSQWTLVFFLAVALAVSLVFGRETYHPVLRRRRIKQLGLPEPTRASPWKVKAGEFVTVALARPLHMLFTEPVVGFVCLYVACEFATLFSFFAAVPYVFATIYSFDLEQSGLVFLAIVLGCLLGSLSVVICEILLYRRQMPKYAPSGVPPEHRLYPAMIGSACLPLGLFWFAWTARPEISWASPAVAIVPFAMGNFCIFVSLTHYLTDTYIGSNIASAMSANSLARYSLAAASPLFTIQMYSRLGVAWAGTLLGLISLALMPVPWVLFKYGKQIRARSQYETSTL
ncbi:hypothetical protein MAPG_06576 [Magnaporthiopsis poae ATCC 64411]|uniref:Major facilitator superfamily (MFS) profile domain-containing protein n=1 Tax=Magnaporthiopsis poae (strain ATCC 64411 / 73-15) TaxID=644358 RepID=A0A0C4E2E1_MAGP6|nr:hypothetical protein MAPG_06576 [Magnaporthiopsis poae ATCC 64411]